MSHFPWPYCRYCQECLELEFPPGLYPVREYQARHATRCPRAPWRIQPGWQYVGLVDTPWWRRLLGR